jgi:branched-chain amino acid transport system permease protein
MSAATQLYMSTLVVYFFVDLIACWGLDLQFGVSGVLNFAFIVFQAAGAYAVAIFSLGPASSNGGFQQYSGGWHLPFPLPLLMAMLVGGVLSAIVGVVALRRLRSDYLAMVLLVVSVIATVIATAQTSFLNGPAGLSLIPKPFESTLGLSAVGYDWFFVALSGVFCVIVGLFVWRVVHSPLGRVLRAMRENEEAVRALGRNPEALQLLVFVAGGMLAALSGALLAEFISAWARSGWLYVETFALFTAVIVGGRGNPIGVAVGAAFILVGVQQAVTYLPATLSPSMTASLEWIVTGVATLVFLWLRPQGIFPERRRRFPRPLTSTARMFTLGPGPRTREPADA